MQLPDELFSAAVKSKKVFKFTSDRINTDVPHYHICIRCSDDEVLVMMCCTSKFETIHKFIELRQLPASTLVPIFSNNSDVFPKDTYINCNNPHRYTFKQFKEINTQQEVEFLGEIDDIIFEQILIGLQESPLVDDELKQLLPDFE